jgi:Bacterial Ig-like domain (group 2)
VNSQALLMRSFVILAILSLVFLAGCGAGTSQSLNNQPPPPLPATISVTVSPPSVTVQPGGVQQFTATVSPSGVNQAVTWSVSGTGCTGASCGMIDTTGKYTGPATAANPLSIKVTATSAADPSKSDSAMVTVMVLSSTNNANLSGQYALLLSGFAGANSVAGVGSFIADGNGNLIAGGMDVTWGNAVYHRTLANSTYSVGSDNRGMMNLNFAMATGPDLFFTFSFALDSFSPAGLATRGRLIESTVAGMSGTGFFVKQDAAAFSTAAINGGYAFGLAGPQGIDENVALGRFTASGGSLSAGHIDLVGFGNTSGLQPDQPFTGTYSVDGGGRGEATLNISGRPNPLAFILYVVSSGESLWMDAGGSAVTGTALQQSGEPFNASSLNSTAVFGAAGFTVAGNDVTVGEVQFDGKGNLSGTNDENYFGLSFPNEPITGTYTVDPNGLGRGAINEGMGPGLSNFYLVSPGRGFIISGNDSLECGTFEPQTGGPFSNASFSGNYALGTLPLLSSPGTTIATGVLSADGVGNLSGTLTTKAGTETFTGNYSVTVNGRATLSITPTSGSPSNLVFYFVSSSRAVAVQMTDFGPPNAAVNVIEK